MVYDATFHDTVAQLGGNPWLRDSLARLRSHLHMYRLYHHAGQAAATKPEHVAIAKAVAAGDADAAAPPCGPTSARRSADRRRLRLGQGHDAGVTQPPTLGGRTGAPRHPLLQTMSSTATFTCGTPIVSTIRGWPRCPTVGAPVTTSATSKHQHAAAGVRHVVLVQAADALGDTELMIATAAANPRVAGIVAWVPIDDAAAADACLTRWKAAPIVGARHLVHRHPDPALLTHPRVAEALDLLVDRRLVFERARRVRGPAATRTTTC